MRCKLCRKRIKPPKGCVIISGNVCRVCSEKVEWSGVRERIIKRAWAKGWSMAVLDWNLTRGGFHAYAKQALDFLRMIKGKLKSNG